MVMWFKKINSDTVNNRISFRGCKYSPDIIIYF